MFSKKKRMFLLGLSLSLCLLVGCGASEREENQSAYKTIGINAMQEGDYESAIEAFDNALAQSLGKVGVDEIDICYYKAICQYKTGDTEAAIETYTNLIAYDKDLSDAYYLRGNMYLESGDTESAIADYNTAVDKDAKDLDLYIAISENLNAMGESEASTSFLEMATTSSGNSSSDYARRGRAYTLLGDYEEAEDQLDLAIQAGSDLALLYKGQLYVEEGKTDEARELFEEYVSEHEGDADALNTLGCMEMEIGEYEEALSYFTEALSIAETDGSDTQEIERNLILAYEYCGDFESAKVAMELYAENYTLDAEFEREYIFLQTR